MTEPQDPPMAIDNPAGDPRPRYDQYALNDPDSIDKPAQAARRARGAAGEDGAHDMGTGALEAQQAVDSGGSAGASEPGKPDQATSD